MDIRHYLIIIYLNRLGTESTIEHEEPIDHRYTDAERTVIREKRAIEIYGEGATHVVTERVISD